jgi:hypothetical protein
MKVAARIGPFAVSVAMRGIIVIVANAAVAP